jgi:hypothetical protein
MSMMLEVLRRKGIGSLGGECGLRAKSPIISLIYSSEVGLAEVIGNRAMVSSRKTG